MFKHTTCLTLALIALLELSSAARLPRHIWPFSSSSQAAEEEALISEKHAEILRQNGFGEYLDLSAHPLWKIHKYEGIDLKPVQVEAEIIKSAGQQPEQQLLDARNPVSSVAPLTESQDELTTEPLSDLGLLSYLLSSVEEEQLETDKASALADSIVNEEQSHPGFFGKLWSMLPWGSAKSSLSEAQAAEGIEADSALFNIALPATKENYAEINIIRPITHGAQLEIQQQQQQQPVNQANQYAFTAGVKAVAKPVAQWYKPSKPIVGDFSHSSAWVSSWNPNAAYNVHVQGPADNPAEHLATVQVYSNTNLNNVFQRKASEDEEQSDLKNLQENTAYIPTSEQLEAVLNYTTDGRNNLQRNSQKNAEDRVDEAPILADIETVKEEAANANSSRNASGTSAIINNTTQRIVSEDERKEKLAAVTEGQVQQVAQQLESSTVSGLKLKPTLRQKAVSALKMGLVPQKFLRQLQLSEQEIDDFINNREGSNKTWDKIRGHLNKLGPLSPKVRRWFFV